MLFCHFLIKSPKITIKLRKTFHFKDFFSKKKTFIIKLNLKSLKLTKL